MAKDPNYYTSLAALLAVLAAFTWFIQTLTEALMP